MNTENSSSCLTHNANYEEMDLPSRSRSVESEWFSTRYRWSRSQRRSVPSSCRTNNTNESPTCRVTKLLTEPALLPLPPYKIRASISDPSLIYKIQKQTRRTIARAALVWLWEWENITLTQTPTILLFQDPHPSTQMELLPNRKPPAQLNAKVGDLSKRNRKHSKLTSCQIERDQLNPASAKAPNTKTDMILQNLPWDKVRLPVNGYICGSVSSPSTSTWMSTGTSWINLIKLCI